MDREFVVILNNGKQYGFTLDCKSDDDARSKAVEIGSDGFWHNDGKTFVLYPSHIVKSVEIKGGVKTSSPRSVIY